MGPNVENLCLVGPLPSPYMSSHPQLAYLTATRLYSFIPHPASSSTLARESTEADSPLRSDRRKKCSTFSRTTTASDSVGQSASTCLRECANSGSFRGRPACPGAGQSPQHRDNAADVCSPAIRQTYLCLALHSIFWGFYRLVSPFVDPVTKDKIRFNPDTRTLVPPSQLDKEIFGGDYDFVYKHEEYYSYLDQMCRKRREEQFARWQQFGGGKAGLSEFMSKGGMEEARDAAARAEAAEDAKKQAQALPSGGDAGGAAGIAPAATAAAASSGEASRPQSSYAPSTNSSGYREPPEAATAADWVEPPSDSTPPSSVHTAASPTMSGGHGGDTSRHDQDVLDSVPRSATRPRGASNDSFVTSREDLATTPQPVEAQLPSISQQQNAPAPVSATGNGNAGVDGLSTGVKGMVIKPDGSIGFA